MLLLFLVPYTLPYFINPIVSQLQNESQSTPVLHADALENKPIFVSSSNSDHQPTDAKVDNPEAHANGHNTNGHEEFHHYHAEVPRDDKTRDINEGNRNNEYLTNDNNGQANEHSENKNDRNHDTNTVNNNARINYDNTNSRRNTYKDGVYRDRIERKQARKHENKKNLDVNIPQTDDGVVFVPESNNERRSDDDDEYKNINDLMNGRGSQKMYDVMEGRAASAETDPPSHILFVSGKNNENIGKAADPDRPEPHEDARATVTKGPKPVPVDCKNLHCTMSTNAVCGVKREDNQWRFRIFKNHCYFLKVNCRFSYDANRYMLQPLEKCKHIGQNLRKSLLAPPVISPWFFTRPRTTTQMVDTRRNIYRRSLGIAFNGRTCDHVCPLSCPEQYQPQCAMSDRGTRRVFLNHCKLDYHSCKYNTVWQEKPLSECVGDDKADVRSNRGFIGWMQRVGIVDGRGKLVLE